MVLSISVHQSSLSINSTNVVPSSLVSSAKLKKMPSNINQSSAKNSAMENVTRDFPLPRNWSIKEKKVDFYRQILNLKTCIVKMAIFPKLIYKFKHSLIKILDCFSAEIDTLILKFNWNARNIE